MKPIGYLRVIQSRKKQEMCIRDSTEEECEALGRLIAPWHNVVGLEMLPYHTMGIVKYDHLGLEYPLKGVPAMDKGLSLIHI